jgi:hypothetical protein
MSRTTNLMPEQENQFEDTDAASLYDEPDLYDDGEDE